ncbi:MAG: DNA repair protein RecO [Clostridia bacterium]
MPVILSDGIVTRYTNYRENDRIISIFTIDHGRIDAKARGCRKATSALLPVCQPFVFGQFELYSAKEKYTVNQCEIKETFFPIREDYGRFATASAALQLVHHAVQENQPNESLFTLLYHALSYLAYGSADSQDLFCCFLIRYLNAIGYRPAVTTCAHCGRDLRGDATIRFSAALGGAVCMGCATYADEISKTALEGLRRMLLLADNEMDRVRLTEPIRREITNALTAYTAYVLDYGKRSLEVLTDMENVGRTSEGDHKAIVL